MSIRISCPFCRAEYNLNDQLLGKKVRCTHCTQTFTVQVDSPGAARAKGSERGMLEDDNDVEDQEAIRLIKTLASIGVRIRVTPWDEIYVKMSEQDAGNYINDPTPFEFLVEGRLEDGQIFYGLYGPVVSGPERYHNLICNIFLRADASDWRISSKSQAYFKVGPSKATRWHSHDFRHPEGTKLTGWPLIARFGEICVVSTGHSE